MSKDLRTNNKNFVDQNNRISFKFNDQSLYGYKGDTLASDRKSTRLNSSH